MQPALAIDGSPGGGFVLEVTEHDVIATRAYLTDLADRNGLSGLRADDLHLDVRHRGADGIGLVGDGIGGPGHQGDRRALGLAEHDRSAAANDGCSIIATSIVGTPSIALQR